MTRKDHDWWDRVYTVMDLHVQATGGCYQPFMDGAPCDECGSQFPEHRCCMRVVAR